MVNLHKDKKMGHYDECYDFINNYKPEPKKYQEKIKINPDKAFKPINKSTPSKISDEVIYDVQEEILQRRDFSVFEIDGGLPYAVLNEESKVIARTHTKSTAEILVNTTTIKGWRVVKIKE